MIDLFVYSWLFQLTPLSLCIDTLGFIRCFIINTIVAFLSITDKLMHIFLFQKLFLIALHVDDLKMETLLLLLCRLVSNNDHVSRPCCLQVSLLEMLPGYRRCSLIFIALTEGLNRLLQHWYCQLG